MLTLGWLFCASLLADYDLNSSMMPVIDEPVETEETLLKNPVLKEEEQESDESEESFDYDNSAVVDALTQGLMENAEEMLEEIEEIVEENLQEDEEMLVTTSAMIIEESYSLDDSSTQPEVASLVDDTAEDFALHEESVILPDEYESSAHKADGEAAIDSDEESEDWTKVDMDDIGLNPVLSEADYSEDEAHADDAFKLERTFIAASETAVKKPWSEKILDWFRPLIAS